MAPNSSRLKNFATYGDVSQRDLYLRDVFQCSTSASISHGFYQISGTTATSAAAEIVDLSSDVGTWSLYTKASGTTLDTDTATARVTISDSTAFATPVSVKSNTLDTFTSGYFGLTLSSSATGFNVVDNAGTTMLDVDTLGNTQLGGTLTVNSNAYVSGDATFIGNCTTYGTFAVSGAATLGSSLSVSSSASIGGALSVTGALSLSSSAAITGDVSVGGTLSVTGDCTYDGTLTVNGSTLTVQNASTPSKAVVVGEDYVSFGGMWRLKYDDSSSTLQIQSYDSVSSAWVQRHQFLTR